MTRTNKPESRFFIRELNVLSRVIVPSALWMFVVLSSLAASLENDPNETQSLASQQPKRVNQLVQLLNQQAALDE